MELTDDSSKKKQKTKNKRTSDSQSRGRQNFIQILLKNGDTEYKPICFNNNQGRTKE